MEMEGDFDRLLFFEHTRKAAEASYAKDPLNAEVRFSSLIHNTNTYMVY